MILSKKRITKALISLRRLVCTFIVHKPRRQVFLRPGPYVCSFSKWSGLVFNRKSRHAVVTDRLPCIKQFKPTNMILVWQQALDYGFCLYSKTCVKQPLKNRQSKDLNDKWYKCSLMKVKMLPLEHSAILLPCIKQWLVLKTNFFFFE